MKRSRSSSRNCGRAPVHSSSNALVHPASMLICTLLDYWYSSRSHMPSPRLPFVSQLPTTTTLMSLTPVVHSPPLLLVWSTSPSSQAPLRSHTPSPRLALVSPSPTMTMLTPLAPVVSSPPPLPVWSTSLSSMAPSWLSSPSPDLLLAPHGGASLL